MWRTVPNGSTSQGTYSYFSISGPVCHQYFKTNCFSRLSVFNVVVVQFLMWSCRRALSSSSKAKKIKQINKYIEHCLVTESIYTPLQHKERTVTWNRLGKCTDATHMRELLIPTRVLSFCVSDNLQWIRSTVFYYRDTWSVNVIMLYLNDFTWLTN